MNNKNNESSTFNTVGTFILFMVGLSVLAYYAYDMGLETFYERYWWVLILLGVTIFIIILAGVIHLSKKQGHQESPHHTIKTKPKEKTMLDDDDPFSKYDK